MNSLEAAYNKRVTFNYDVFNAAWRDIATKTRDASRGLRTFINLGLPATAYAFTASGYDGHASNAKGEIAFSPWLLVSQVVAGASRIPARDLQLSGYNRNLVRATMRAVGMPDAAYFAAQVKVNNALQPDIAAAVRQLDAWARSHPAPRASAVVAPSSPNLPPPVTVTPSLPVPSPPQSPFPGPSSGGLPGWAKWAAIAFVALRVLR